MNPDGTTTLNDFANVWLEADASVRRLIANSDMKIRESQIKRDETGVQLRAVKEHENYNPNMLIGESKLTIEIIDGRGFVNERNQQFNPCIFVFCENQRYEVRNADMDQQGRFVWNERVTIPIKYAKSDFLIQVSSYSNPLLPIMEISYPLERLSDQIAHSETLTLQFMDGTASNATVNCNMQWLYSRSKFYTNIIDLLDKEIQRDTQDKKAAEEGLRGLYMLFPTFNAVLPRNVNYATMGRFNDLQPKVASNEPTLGRAAKGTSTYARPIMYLSFAIFILAMLCCFIKAQFLDLCIALTWITSTIIGVPRMTFRLGLVFIGMIVVSLILDFVWFLYYRSPWWNEKYIDDNSLNGTRVFTVIMVIFLWFVKIVLLVLNIFNLSTLPISEGPPKNSQWRMSSDGGVASNNFGY